MTLHVLERLAATNPDCEIWFDSAPLIFESWARETLAAAPAARRDDRAAQLARFFDPARVAQGQMGFGGVTTNPPLMLKALEADPDFWGGEIRRLARTGGGVETIYWRLYLEVVRRSAAMVLPVWKASGGRYGFVSGQVDPRFVTDEARMLSEGLQLASQGDNVMVKIPGSAEGYRVIEDLTARGIATNNTTSFTVPQYRACMDAVTRGLARARADRVDITRWRSVITHMSARLGNIGDLQAQAASRGISLTPEEVLEGEIAVFKRAYHSLQEAGHPSKMLQCSMRLSDPGLGHQATCGHIEMLAGGNVVYTCPPGFIAQLMDVEDRFPGLDPAAIDRVPPAATIEKLRRLPYFRQAYDWDGMRPEEFSRFAAFTATAAEFAAATRRTVDFVASALEDAAAQAGIGG